MAVTHDKVQQKVYQQKAASRMAVTHDKVQQKVYQQKAASRMAVTHKKMHTPPPKVVHDHRPVHRPAPVHFRGWRRGRVVHATYRSCWVGNIWYDSFGYPCYSPEYLAVTPVANTVVYTTTPAPVVVTPVQPSTVIVTPPPPPPPRRPGPVTRLLDKLF